MPGPSLALQVRLPMERVSTMSGLAATSPLVRVPGEVADSRIWGDQVATFAERYMVVRFDRLGRQKHST